MSDGAGAPVDRARYPYRMKDLCAETGLDRQTIHFYIQQRLVPEGRKTGRNMAYYGPEHLQRLRLVRRLQREQFLPLKAIRAIVEGEGAADGFTPPQRRLLADVKQRLASALGGDEARRELVPVAPLLVTHDVARGELRGLEQLGLISIVDDPAGAQIPRDDVWVLEFWGGLRALGVLEALGLSVEDLATHEEAVTRMFEHEKRLLLPRALELPPARAAELVERALPLINTFVTRYHHALVRNFLAALG